MGKNEYDFYEKKVLFSQCRDLVAQSFGHFENKKDATIKQVALYKL